MPETMKMILLRIQCSFFDTHHLAVLHLHDAVGKFVDAAVVGDDDDAALVGENVLSDEFDDVAAGIAVERCGGLIEYQNIGAANDSSGDGHPLLLPPPEFHRRQLRSILQADDL